MVLIWKGSVVAVYPTKTHRWKRDNGTKTRHTKTGYIKGYSWPGWYFNRAVS